MSKGMLNNPSGPRNNFGYQISNLQLLGAIAASVVPPPGGLATEATLLQVLTAIQNGKEFEQILVMDLGAPAPYPTYVQIRIWNSVTHTFDPPVYYNAAGAVVVPIGPLQVVNPQYVLDNILLQVTAINADLDVALSTRASEATLLATNILLTTISGRLDVNLSTRASEATLLLVNAALTTLNATAAAQATEATQLLVLAQLTAINADLDVALSTRASEATLLAFSTKYTSTSRTPSVVNVPASSAGSTTAGVQEMSILVIGGGNTVGGASIPSGTILNYKAKAGDTVGALAYTTGAGANRLIITYLT